MQKYSKKKIVTALSLLMALPLSGCQTGGGANVQVTNYRIRSFKTKSDFIPGCGEGKDIGFRILDCLTPEAKRMYANPASSSEVLAAMNNTTRRTYLPQHGTQITYQTPDGRIYLWYPGNKKVLQGQWTLKPSRNSRSAGLVCFSYSANSYNPVTGHTGAGWVCASATEMLRFATQETEQGDVFGLSTREEVPFVLPKSDTSIAKLKGKIQK